MGKNKIAWATYMSKLRKRHIAAGMCINCTQPATHGQLCLKHRGQQTARAYKFRQNKHLKGECELCKNPLIEGKKFCLYHYQLTTVVQRESLRRRAGSKKRFFRSLSYNFPVGANLKLGIVREE